MSNEVLHKQIRQYCAWYRITQGWMALQCVLFAVTSTLAAYIACDKLFYLGAGIALPAMILASVGLLALLVLFVVRSGSVSLVGYAVDRSAGLKNLVSSGLCVTMEQCEVSSVVVERACGALNAQTPRKLLPFKLMWTGRYLYIPVLLLLIAVCIPQVDLFSRKQAREKKEEEKISVQKSALKLTATMTALESKLTSTNSMENKAITKNLDMLVQDLKGIGKNEALLKLGEFENTYKKEFSAQRNFEQAAKAMQTTPDMKGLAPESQKQLQKLMEDFKKGDFKDAAAALKELANQLQSKTLSAEEKKDLARELAKLAEAMKGQGISDELAKLLRQIESSPADLDDLLKQCQKAGSELSDLANFCDQCDGFQAMKEGLKEAKKEMLGDSFSDFDAKEVEQYLESEAMLGGTGSGPGMGGEGHGRGGLALENMTTTAFKKEMSQSKINKRKILPHLFVSGVPEKGESVTEYSDVVESARKQAASSLAKDKIPREYETMVKTYFDSLDKKSGETKQE